MLLLFVGRGSREVEATREMAQFARLRRGRQPVGRLEACFLAMADPSLEEALEVIAGLPFPRVVVQPHLLFPGELLQRVKRATAAAAAREPHREWIVTGPLGGDAGLAAAVVEISGRVSQGLPR
jgi:sirohydrochlorin cobaltochelatase